MVSLLSEIHFWSTHEDINIKANDYSCYKYYKKEVSDNNISLSTKKHYSESRGIKHFINNKRPERLRDKLRELENVLLQNKIIFVDWTNDILLKLLLSSGLIVKINVKNSSFIGINFDKTLLGKIQTEVICDGVLIGNQIICACKDGRIFGVGGLYKDWCIESGLRKNLSYHNELLVLWGRTNVDHPQPWSPLAKDHQRANLQLYWLGAVGPELLAFKKTDGEPIKVIVSKFNHRCIIVVEQKVTHRGAVSIEVCLFEVIGNALKRSSVTAVPLQTQISCLSLSKQENFLILGCIDGSLAILDRNKGSSKIIKTSFIPRHVTWHESEAISAISNDRGQIQYYDSALNCLSTQLMTEEASYNMVDISSYFTTQHIVQSLFWGNSNLLVCMEQGPIIIITHVERLLSYVSLIQMYLQNEKVEHAIRLLLTWKFNEHTLGALQKIVSHLMKSALNNTSAKLLQEALGSFHCPTIPLSAEIRHKYGAQVKSLTRRFFHQLIRSKMFETAFLLAVDLGHHDLFMDIYYIAVKVQEVEMAAAARAQASALLSRCSSEASVCSRSSCSQCSSETSSNTSVSTGRGSDIESNIDHYLTTNFNQPSKPYKQPYTPPIPSIDLPKIKLLNKMHSAPPLPLLPPLPPTLNFQIDPQTSSNLNYNSIANNNSKFLPIRTVPIPPRLPPFRISAPLRLAPPLPLTASPIPPNINSTQPKKQQAKVKFSDTVTAFIVPEVKRPVRLPPPAHVTDPQKELADSLPLCHPNEDYLKDFTPIRKESNGSPPVQPKIKVVHFGVV